jgi:hypothetical protein
MPRNLNAILKAAEDLIDPRKDDVELFQATLETAISTVRGIHKKTANLPSPGEMRDRVEAYLTALRVVKKKANAVAPLYWPKAFDGRSRPDETERTGFLRRPTTSLKRSIGKSARWKTAPTFPCRMAASSET